MKIRAMNMGFGAHVEEADLTALTQDDADGLRTALLEHGLLVIRNQKLSRARQVRMSEVFGTLETFAPGEGRLAEYPQIFRVASRPAEGHTRRMACTGARLRSERPWHRGRGGRI